jgi:hypothetical protein
MKARALTFSGVVAALVVVSAVATSPSPATLNGGGVQATPGGVVKDKTGGYYDPARSIYIPASPSAATPVTGGGVQTKPGGIVKDKTGGYYDPALSTYITPTGNAAAAIAPVSSRGFSWTDATVGAGTATGTILILLGATLVTLRRRSLAA